jgi:hypothetical protein
MNNTRNILLIAIIVATLVMGTSVIPMQTYAGKDNNDNHKKGKDFSKIIASSESDKKSANQHQDQDNFCYRGDECQQANQGQQIVGKDNDAKGFNDQSDNLAVELTANNGTGTGNGNGNGNGGTLAQKCELCLLNVDLTAFFQNPVVVALGIDTTAELCAALAAGHLPTPELAILLGILTTAQEQCLIDAGIVLSVRT